MARAVESSVSEMACARAAFLEAYPSYAKTARLDQLRASEYARLDAQDHVYLDYTGGGLYGVSQLSKHFGQLAENVFGNPHSNNLTSRAMTTLVERARTSVLAYFGASPEEYFTVFTPNASGALKLAGESYPFGPKNRYLLTFDNHNSVNGIREFARARGAEVTYVPVAAPDLRLDRKVLAAELTAPGKGRGLFAFPAQSNFSGVQHPLELIGEAHETGWDVLLDAAAYVPTNRLDLSKWRPDFVTVSFYKMFGYPTGVGCLLMKRSLFAKLKRPWFAGGTIRIASVQGNGHYLMPDAAAYEDGTVDYANLPAIEIGLEHITSIGLELIHERVRCLIGWLLENLTALRHSNGRPLVEIYGPRNLEARGGTISFGFVDPGGESFDIRRVEELANGDRISIRTGCFCNPGAGEVAFGLSPAQIAAFFRDERGLTFDQLRERIRTEYGKEVGAMRISVGLASNFADVFRFLQFARGFLDRTAADVGRIDPGAPSCSLVRDGA
jgi:molybdenum cofactor sulfurtransferase